jgi:hypothetical protein
MKWHTIKEALEVTNLSRRTIQRKAKDYSQKYGQTCVKYDHSKKAYYSESFINSIIEGVVKVSSESVSNVAPNDALKEDYIQHLKREIEALRSQLKDYSEQFTNFQAIELQAMERLKEQNHIIMQLEMVAEERLKKIEVLTSKKEDSIISENIEDVKSEEVKLSDEPEPSLDKLNKHRQDVLKDILAKGEAEAEARRNNNKYSKL